MPDLTDEQQAIIKYVAGKGSLVVDAGAGTGKTFTILNALGHLPERTALLCAFNRDIADELQAKLPRLPRGMQVQVKTFHGAGYGIVRAHFPRITLDKTATEELINRAAGNAFGFKLRRAAVNTLRTVKEVYAEPEPPSEDKINEIALTFDHFGKISSLEAELCIEVIRDAYILSLDMASREAIDYPDMIWAPLALGLAPKSRFKAVFVDELQDISGPQLALMQKLMAPGARFIGIGDVNQQIYGWRGSLGAAAWDRAREEFNAEFLPLTMTWRCAKAITREAQALVSTLRARPDAPDGIVQTCAWDGLPAALGTQRKAAAKPTKTSSTDFEIALSGETHTFVLSRSNAALLDCALFLWRHKVGFQLNAGKELLDPLFMLLDYKLDLRKENFLNSLGEWEQKELDRAEKANAAAYADRVEEQAKMLRVAATYVEPSRIRGLLADMMTPNDSGVMLSTVHKAKGLEAQRVFLLKQTFARHDHRACKFCQGSGQNEYGRQCNPCHGTGRFEREIKQEELNIEYVAITRAISRLVWVDMTKSASLKIEVSSARAVARGMVDDQVTKDRTEGEIDRVSRRMLGIKTEAEQLVDVAAQFPTGIPREVSEARLTVRGEHARDLVENDIEEP